MARPRVVLDTNVVVSAHLNASGYERFVLDLALAGKIQICVSDDIFEEYAGVLRRAKFGIAKHLIDASLLMMKKASRHVRPRHKVTASEDPEDNKFLECAEAAGADYLITGNKRHFPKLFVGTRVVNAREFLEETIPSRIP
jgi:putative PIN family toxin of toxin-antitoxin system